MAADPAHVAPHVAQSSDEDQIVSGLAEFGLGRNEARLYLAAVGRRSMRAAQLAARAQISRTKAYDALRLLVDKGLFTEEPGRVARFRAADASMVASLLRRQTFTEKASLVEDTSRLVADLFDRYYATTATDDPFESVHVLRNEEAAWARQETIIAGARAEVVRTRRRPLGGALHMDELSLRPGVSYRAIYEREVLADPAFPAWVAERGVRGERYRFVERVNASICVVDRTAVLLSLNPKDRRGGAPGNWLAFEHPGLGGLLAEVFEGQWRDASLPIAAYGTAQ
jgi:Sugar-specific transcriptional regulator TrmB